jgi:hypothetical protein
MHRFSCLLSKMTLLNTAPTDAALRYDIEVTKQLGFNWWTAPAAGPTAALATCTTSTGTPVPAWRWAIQAGVSNPAAREVEVLQFSGFQEVLQVVVGVTGLRSVNGLELRKARQPLEDARDRLVARRERDRESGEVGRRQDLLLHSLIAPGPTALLLEVAKCVSFG